MTIHFRAAGAIVFGVFSDFSNEGEGADEVEDGVGKVGKGDVGEDGGMEGVVHELIEFALKISIALWELIVLEEGFEGGVTVERGAF